MAALATDAAAVDAVVPVVICSTIGCGKPAVMKCPTCIQLNLLPTALFCEQSCFKSSWKHHNNSVHKVFIGKRDYKAPDFAYTGELRPHYISPQLTVTDKSIRLPDYAITAFPESEAQARGDRTIPHYTEADIKGVRLACDIGRAVLDIAHAMIAPGVTTDEIDVAVHNATLALKAYPSPLNYHSFPKSCCTSVNEVICHGIPDSRALVLGDIVNVDISVYKDGYHGDLNETFIVGAPAAVSAESKQLVKVTHDALMAAVAAVKPGMFYREIGEIVSAYCKPFKLSVVRSYCGHGIGRLFHCMPNVPHYSNNKAVGIAKAGHIFTIEPMINVGTYRDQLWDFDHWTSTTHDGKRSAQFEHTLLVTDTGCELLTGRLKTSPPLWWEVEEAAAATTVAETISETATHTT